MNATVMRTSVAKQVPCIRILGTRVCMVQIPEVVGLMEYWIEAERSECHWIVVTGMHGVIEGHKDRKFQAILNSADLFIPDGFSLIWIARRRGFPLRERASGSELMRECCSLAASKGYRNFFYGDTEETLQLLTTRLKEDLPDLQVVGLYSPPFRPLSPEEDAEIVRRINEARPDILWVGLGLPKQERWIFEHRDRLKVPVAVGVGAAFKFISGQVRRAPAWVGNHGLEWLWRFLHEPRKLWRRALLDVPRFICLALLELSGLKRYDAARHDMEGHRRLTPILKRPFDVLLSGLGLVLSAPLWAVASVLIKLEDGGPVFYGQERVGQGGRQFRSWKFRSMVPDSDERFGPLQARDGDARVTRVGRLLRATAMDELPQLWNIFIGDMSFVGPRALLPEEIEVGANEELIPLEKIPGYATRHRVRPGLTGIAQIYAPRDIPRRHKFKFDLLYIKKQTFWLDIRLILLSFWISMRGKWESRQRKF